MIGGVDAYIDNKGVWHDDNELWNEWEREGMRVFMETGSVPEGNPHEEIPKMFEEKVDKFINEEVRDEKLPEEQHKQGEHDGRHRNDSFLFPCYDESSLFDKADESHSVTSI